MLLRNYANNMDDFMNCLQETHTVIERTVGVIFTGGDFFWRDHPMAVIEQLQQLCDRFGGFLTDLDRVAQLLAVILKAMQGQDAYAFADHLLVLDEYLRSQEASAAEDRLSGQRRGRLHEH